MRNTKLRPKSRNQGEAHGASKLTERDVREIKALIKTNVRISRIAAVYGVTGPAISQIKSGYTWSHIR